MMSIVTVLSPVCDAIASVRWQFTWHPSRRCSEWDRTTVSGITETQEHWSLTMTNDSDPSHYSSWYQGPPHHCSVSVNPSICINSLNYGLKWDILWPSLPIICQWLAVFFCLAFILHKFSISLIFIWVGTWLWPGRLSFVCVLGNSFIENC